jgi:hypothetical protein
VRRPIGIPLDVCGGERVAQLDKASTVHDLAFANDKLAWIGEASTGVSAVHVLDLATRRVELRNEATLYLTSHDDDFAWASAARITFGTSAINSAGDVRGLALDATHLTYVEQLGPGRAQVVRRERVSLEAISLGEGQLSPVVAVDGSSAWYAVTGTSDEGQSSTFRRVSLRGGPFTEHGSVRGEPLRLAANSVRAAALVRPEPTTTTRLLVDMTADGDRPRTLLQGGALRDFALTNEAIYASSGKSVLRVDGDGSVTDFVHGTCEISAIAATPGDVYFVAWNEGGGAIYRYVR